MRLIDYFDQGMSLAPEAECLVGEDLSLSYAQVYEHTMRIACALRTLGISAAGLLTPNDVRGFAAMLGVLRGEVVLSALNVRSSVEDNAKHLGFSAPRALIYHSAAEEQAFELRKHVPSLEVFVCIDRHGRLGPSLDEWIRPYDGTPVELLPDDPTRVYRIAITGGTTGKPKGVPHVHLQAMTNMLGYLTIFRYESPPRFLIASAMTHAAGHVGFHVLALGGALHIMPHAEPQAVLGALSKRRINATLMPPTILYSLLAQANVREFDYSALRYLMVGAAPVSSEKLREAVSVFGPTIGQLYGQTESPMITYLAPDVIARAVQDPAARHLLASCGRPFPTTLVALMDDDGRLVPDGARGEIVVRSNQVARGYANDAEATRQMRAFGWHHTSDIGYRDKEGFYYIVDRKRDVIITGGFNVFPNEVEQILLRHPAVEDCVVVGVPDEKWGEAVRAIVQLKPGATVSEADVLSLCRRHLGGVKMPKAVEFWESLPRSAVGKVLRRVVREHYWRGVGRAI